MTKNNIAPVDPNNAAAEPDAPLSRKELDHFFTVYFDIKIICDNLLAVNDLPEQFKNRTQELLGLYANISLQQIDRCGYQNALTIYKNTLELNKEVTSALPDTAENLKIDEKTIDDTAEAQAVTPEEEASRKLGVKVHIIIAALVLLVFGCIVFVTVPPPWMQTALGDLNVASGDYESAEKLYRQAAEGGNARAQFKLALLYETGDGVEQDYEEAVKWYRKAAYQNLAKAQYALAQCLDEGRGVERNYEEAVRFYRDAAEQNHAGAQYKMGVFYQNDDTLINNAEEAFNWFKKAAEQKYTKAQFSLGYCYHMGFGTVKSITEAEIWFQQAAEKGDAKAQYYLALYCAGENGKEADPIASASWMRKSAQQDNIDAQFMLAKYYEKGFGVKKNIREAVRWYAKADKNGHPDAQAALAKIAKESIINSR